MFYVNAIIILFILVLISSLFCLKFERNLITRRELSIILFLFFIFRVISLEQSFWGIEYEDSYIYNASSRYLLFNQPFQTDALLTESCSLGSLRQCELSGTYSGHLIGYSSFLYFIHSIFGYTHYNIKIINLCISLLSTFFLLIVSKLILNKSPYAYYVTLLCFLSPIANVYYGSGYVEPFSSFFLIFCFYAFIKLFDDSQKSSFNYFLIIITSLIIIFIKRENIIFLPILLISRLVITNIIYKKNITHDSIKYLLLIALIIFSLFSNFFLIDVNKTIAAELPDIANKFPFQFSFFKRIFPVMISTLSNFKLFSLIPIGLFAIALTHKGELKRIIYLITISISYLMIYSFHYRGYYFYHYNSLQQIEMIRYIMNYYPFLILLSAYGFINLTNRFSLLKRCVIPVFVFTLAYSAITTSRLNDDLFEIESNYINGYNEIISTINDNNEFCLITDKLLLLQSIAKDDVFLIDVELLNADFDLINDLVSKKTNLTLLISSDFLITNKDRYINQIRFIDSNDFRMKYRDEHIMIYVLGEEN